MNQHATVIVLSLASALATQPAVAADPSEQAAAPAAEGRAWALQVTPYLWVTGLKGDISPFRQAPTLAIDKSFSDVLEDLDLGGFINIWGRRDRFVFSGDLMYVDTSGSHASGPLPAFQIPGLGVPIPPGATIDAEVDTTQFTATLQGGYRMVDTPRLTLDGLVGLRYWRVSNDVSVTASHAAIGTISARHDEDFSWTDPMLGVRAFFPLPDRWSVQAQADIGGFGAGSDFTWSLLATVNYALSDHFSLSTGYKALDVDYEHGGHVFDVRMSGLVVGLTYRF